MPVNADPGVSLPPGHPPFVAGAGMKDVWLHTVACEKALRILVNFNSTTTQIYDEVYA